MVQCRLTMIQYSLELVAVVVPVAWLRVKPETNWMIVALLMSKRQIVVLNPVKVDCSVESGGGFVHPWRLMRVSTLGECGGLRASHCCGFLKCLEC